MPRITLSITCLLLLTSSALIAANDNPFARWENLKRQTEPTASTNGKTAAPTTAAPATPTPVSAKSKTGAVAYFSATAPEKTATEKSDVAKPEAAGITIIKRERLRSGSLETDKTASASAVTTAGYTGPAGQRKNPTDLR